MQAAASRIRQSVDALDNYRHEARDGATVLKRDPSGFAAIDLMRSAVEEYGRTFDDPAFAPKPAKPSSAG